MVNRRAAVILAALCLLCAAPAFAADPDSPTGPGQKLQAKVSWSHGQPINSRVTSTPTSPAGPGSRLWLYVRLVMCRNRT